MRTGEARFRQSFDCLSAELKVVRRWGRIMPKCVAGLLGIVILQCALSGGAAAQVGLTCTATGSNGTSAIGGCPPWGFNCQSPGTFLSVWTEMTYLCPPPDAGPETAACPTCGTAGH